ncbi:hypothetical protein Cgig2_021998 [Carnegiea gigantea]|uniref:Uncharacterized protein n=1 Tax=Carnegiea gigantea TaxID=171969 RepID=A0A9Q1KRA0_9CARY|nr:hypothetical protein Cgig2_021998 [Carnegiea gigantea]
MKKDEEEANPSDPKQRRMMMKSGIYEYIFVMSCWICSLSDNLPIQKPHQLKILAFISFLISFLTILRPPRRRITAWIFRGASRRQDSLARELLDLKKGGGLDAIIVLLKLLNLKGGFFDFWALRKRAAQRFIYRGYFQRCSPVYGAKLKSHNIRGF